MKGNHNNCGWSTRVRSGSSRRPTKRGSLWGIFASRGQRALSCVQACSGALVRLSWRRLAVARRIGLSSSRLVPQVLVAWQLGQRAIIWRGSSPPPRASRGCDRFPGWGTFVGAVQDVAGAAGILAVALAAEEDCSARSRSTRLRRRLPSGPRSAAWHRRGPCSTRPGSGNGTCTRIISSAAGRR
jgi:hypothetical protein